ncbi:MAG: hypothetical protein OSB21_03790, partial [Myxococcota bacterium]|nr:hypothetical protein [Myxococcota bacterium]
MHTRLLTLLLCGSCSLMVNDLPEPMSPALGADAGAGTGNSGTDAGPANPCASDQRFDELGGRCVPLQGASGICHGVGEIATNHSWAV